MTSRSAHVDPGQARASETTAIAPAARLDSVDAARGVAIMQMIAYHVCYDLNYFGWTHAALTRDAPWVAWRTAIVAQFLFIVGVSLALRAGAPPARFWRRWLQVAGCAALVSLASHAFFGARFIWFGVLHFVAVAQLALRRLRVVPSALLLGGAAVIAAGVGLHFDLFDRDAVSWIGFAAKKPRTEDFVPIFPWLGVVLVGTAVAGAWQASQAALARALRQPLGGAWRIPAILGRWPLTVYMVHQPLLWGLFELLALARR